MSEVEVAKSKKSSLSQLERNQLVGGICAGLVVLLACIRIFVLGASPDGILGNLMSIAGAVLSLVVLTSAVHVMLASKISHTFNNVLTKECREIDRLYGDLIEASGENKDGVIEGMAYLIADNVDSIFTSNPEDWDSLHYVKKFEFDDNFFESRKLYYYINHVNMKERAARLGDDLATTARLLARDTAVAIQRSFSDILVVHALEFSQESDRSVVTIHITSVSTSQDAQRIADLINYLLFLHFVAT
ncbi:MAG: hypothetical protein FWG00_02885 [Coriobacteriia bacterium]|nr:hypothetical protein [Coriobacteriia bacterium]